MCSKGFPLHAISSLLSIMGTFCQGEEIIGPNLEVYHLFEHLLGVVHRVLDPFHTFCALLHYMQFLFAQECNACNHIMHTGHSAWCVSSYSLLFSPVQPGLHKVIRGMKGFDLFLDLLDLRIRTKSRKSFYNQLHVTNVPHVRYSRGPQKEGSQDITLLRTSHGYIHMHAHAYIHTCIHVHAHAHVGIGSSMYYLLSPLAHVVALGDNTTTY